MDDTYLWCFARFGKACNFTKSNCASWVFITFLKFYKWYQIAQCMTFRTWWPETVKEQAECHKICSSVINLWEKSLNLGKVIKIHKISFIHFSGKENAAFGQYLIVHLKRYELNPDPRLQTPEHGDIATVLIHNYYYLQTVNTTSDCALSFAEFGLWPSPKTNQGRRGPTIIITPTRYWNLAVCLLLSYHVWILISIVGCLVNCVILFPGE